MVGIEELVGRYVAVWNEGDADRRRAAIAALWAEGATHFTRSLEARGHAAIEARVADAHERFVRAQGFVFTSANNADGHHRAVKFSWLMVPAGGGAAAAAGTVLILLDGDDRISRDYQFAEPLHPS